MIPTLAGMLVTAVLVHLTLIAVAPDALTAFEFAGGTTCRNSGFQTSAPPRAFAIPSVMAHFLDSEIPVIHFSGISTLARRHGLPYPLERPPTLGEGEVYQAVGYRRWLAVTLIVALLAMTWFVVRSAIGRSALGAPRSDATGMQPKV